MRIAAIDIGTTRSRSWCASAPTAVEVTTRKVHVPLGAGAWTAARSRLRRCRPALQLCHPSAVRRFPGVENILPWRDRHARTATARFSAPHRREPASAPVLTGPRTRLSPGARTASTWRRARGRHRHRRGSVEIRSARHVDSLARFRSGLRPPSFVRTGSDYGGRRSALEKPCSTRSIGTVNDCRQRVRPGERTRDILALHRRRTMRAAPPRRASPSASPQSHRRVRKQSRNGLEQRAMPGSKTARHRRRARYSSTRSCAARGRGGDDCGDLAFAKGW